MTMYRWGKGNYLIPTGQVFSNGKQKYELDETKLREFCNKCKLPDDMIYLFDAIRLHNVSSAFLRYRLKHCNKKIYKSNVVYNLQYAKKSDVEEVLNKPKYERNRFVK